MKASELRIGNKIISYGSVTTVESVSNKGINTTASDNGKPYGMHSSTIEWDEFEPIPLTEEWLLKMKFIKYGGSSTGIGYYSTTIKNSITRLENYLEVWTGKYPVFHVRVGEVGYTNKIEYVHQLQNLYFALTGEELNAI